MYNLNDVYIYICRKLFISMLWSDKHRKIPKIECQRVPVLIRFKQTLVLPKDIPLNYLYVVTSVCRAFFELNLIPDELVC